MSKKQTAVEWLEAQFEVSHSYINEIFKETFGTAKEMEKEQITDAYTMGSYDMAEKEFKPEQYYSETYEK